jgi:putative transposase
MSRDRLAVPLQDPKNMKIDPKIHHRRSIRLPGYDYTRAGAYYITIVTWHREGSFGVVWRGR